MAETIDEYGNIVNVTDRPAAGGRSEFYMPAPPPPPPRFRPSSRASQPATAVRHPLWKAIAAAGLAAAGLFLAIPFFSNHPLQDTSPAPAASTTPAAAPPALVSAPVVPATTGSETTNSELAQPVAETSASQPDGLAAATAPDLKQSTSDPADPSPVVSTSPTLHPPAMQADSVDRKTLPDPANPAGSLSTAGASATPPSELSPERRPIPVEQMPRLVPANSWIRARTLHVFDSELLSYGDTIRLEVLEEVVDANGSAAIPAGSRILVRVQRSKVDKREYFDMRAFRLEIGSQEYGLSATIVRTDDPRHHYNSNHGLTCLEPRCTFQLLAGKEVLLQLDRELSLGER